MKNEQKNRIDVGEVEGSLDVNEAFIQK